MNTYAYYFYRFCLAAFLFLYCCYNGHAQDYRPTAIEGANWVMWDSFITDPDFDGVEWAYVLSIEGDTMIQDISYKKVYRRIMDWEPDPLMPPPLRPLPPYLVSRHRQLWGVLRDDLEARTVHGRFPEFSPDELTEEVLLHDYSLEVGDSLRGVGFQGQPGDLDFVVLEKGETTVFGYTVGYQKSHSTFFEGIGSGRFGPSSGSDIGVNNFISVLLDYCQGTDAECQIEFSSSTEQSFDAYDFFLSPNPFADQLNIQASVTGEIKLSLRTSLGQEVRSGKLSGTESWNLGDLPNGVYFLVAQYGNDRTVRKLIKRE